jgi:hypothetical protein
VQVHQRQDLVHLRGPTDVGRQDLAPEPLPVPGLGVGAAVVHPGGPDLDGTGRGDDLAGSGPAVADHQGSAGLVPVGLGGLDVGVDLDLEGHREHPASALGHDVIDREGQVLAPSVVWDYPQIGVPPPRRPSAGDRPGPRGPRRGSSPRCGRRPAGPPPADRPGDRPGAPAALPGRPGPRPGGAPPGPDGRPGGALRAHGRRAIRSPRPPSGRRGRGPGRTTGTTSPGRTGRSSPARRRRRRITPPWVNTRWSPSGRASTNRRTRDARSATDSPPGASKPSKAARARRASREISSHRFPSRAPKSSSRSLGSGTAPPATRSAVSLARARSEVHTPANFRLRSRDARDLAWARPRSSRGTSVHPVSLPAWLQPVDPCRTSHSRTLAATTLTSTTPQTLFPHQGRSEGEDGRLPHLAAASVGLPHRATGPPSRRTVRRGAEPRPAQRETTHPRTSLAERAAGRTVPPRPRTRQPSALGRRPRTGPPPSSEGRLPSSRGRSPDSRITAPPSLPRTHGPSGISRGRSPVTVARPRRTRTGFPFQPPGGTSPAARPPRGLCSCRLDARTPASARQA